MHFQQRNLWKFIESRKGQLKNATGCDSATAERTLDGYFCASANNITYRSRSFGDPILFGFITCQALMGSSCFLDGTPRDLALIAGGIGSIISVIIGTDGKDRNFSDIFARQCSDGKPKADTRGSILTTLVASLKYDDYYLNLPYVKPKGPLQKIEKIVFKAARDSRDLIFGRPLSSLTKPRTCHQWSCLIEAAR